MEAKFVAYVQDYVNCQLMVKEIIPLYGALNLFEAVDKMIGKDAYMVEIAEVNGNVANVKVVSIENGCTKFVDAMYHSCYLI
jgi:hypothetical protein